MIISLMRHILAYLSLISFGVMLACIYMVDVLWAGFFLALSWFCVWMLVLDVEVVEE